MSLKTKDKELGLELCKPLILHLIMAVLNIKEL